MEIGFISGRYPVTLTPVLFLPRPYGYQGRRKMLFYSHVSCNLSSVTKKQRSDTESKDRLFIFGMGFVGLYFAEQMKKEGWEVSGTCTSTIKKKKLDEMGFNTFIFDANDLELGCLSTLHDATHILISIPPTAGVGDPVLCLNQDILRWAKLGSGNLRWMCYLSSTSVYGDCSGAWVNEDYPTNATSEFAKARLVAEKGWLDLGHCLGVLIHVFRLGGIYGPGRSALDTIIKQDSLSEYQRRRESRHYTARVHVADICQALKASIDMPSSRQIYNVVDDDPAPRAEVFAFARTLIQKRWPGQIKESQSPDMVHSMKNISGEKRVSNVRLKEELGVSLLHPTYRSGLQSIIELMENPYR